MLKYRILLLNDARHIWKDPMLMAALLGPIAVIAFARFVFVPLSGWLEGQFAFSLLPYTDFAAVFLLLTIPLLPGTMAGLLMLDERDEHLIGYYAATPLTRGGYLAYRLFMPSLLSALLSAAFILLSDLAVIGPGAMHAFLLLAIEAPCFSLFLAAYAGNKVEGLALSKLSGLLFAGPAVAAFVPEPWQYAGAWIPSYWPAKVYFLGANDEPVLSSALPVAGLLFHLFLLWLLIRAFLKRID
ncbi:hypothetical protein [Paenibacillus arenilitoris]|uniref:Uncharacterized protein n=1 Tax=Paenibacillus arenilitoris TaxID=2772299 RepID=A0A927CRF6_9BACL|nr:hypothetical protein [Paenibacillus arenilitoris]MBD2871777.1 hypothetical protein [Paenibacillus arenilitoris]